jgi:pyruvate,water dikinase
MIHTVLTLKYIDKDDLSIAGRKGVELGEMTQAGLPIPEGFVILSNAYFQFVKENKLEHKIKTLLTTAHFEYADSLMQVSAHIKRMILETPISEELTKDIAANYKELAKKHHRPLLFLHASSTHSASSASNAATAGPSALLEKRELHLYIHGEENLIEKVKEAWASLFEPGALSSRHQHNVDHFEAGMAVIVQRMIETDVSGVMLTQDPTTRDNSKIIIKTNIGGRTSHHFEIEKKHLSLLNSVYTDGSTVLKDSQLIELAKIGKKVEDHNYFPQYIEWALENKKLYILHTRPLIEGEQLKKVTKIKKLLLKGIGVHPGIATGFVKIINHEADNVSSHDIIVLQQITPSHTNQAKKARAIILETGTKGHLSANLRHLEIPVITEAKDARRTLKSGSVITVNGGKGEVYNS